MSWRVSRAIPAHWLKVALVMFAVGWGANQFSPMLIVYRHELGLGAGAIAGLFVIYAVTLVPGLLIGGPLSDRLGRRAVVLPFAALSPVATLLVVAGSRDLWVIGAGRALAGLCSGMVFGPATAWVRDLSEGDGLSARRAALALSAGFCLGPVVAALLAQWAPAPLVIPYLPHLALGTVAFAVGWTAPDARLKRRPAAGRSWPPAPVRARQFWLRVAPPAPLVFGTVSIAIVVLPEEVTSARSLSAAYAGAMTALAFVPGIGIQRLARRLVPETGVIIGTAAAAAGAVAGAFAVASGSRLLAGLAAILLGMAYGLCLVCGLRQSERLSDDHDRGAVVACYYVLAYLGFCAPYAVTGLNALAGQQATLPILAAVALLVLGWLARLNRPFSGCLCDCKSLVALGGFSAGMFNAIHQGHGVKVVGSVAEEGPGAPANALVGATPPDKSGKVTSPAGLKGEKIAVDGGAGSAGAYLLAMALARYDVSLSQVTLVNLKSAEMASALRAGTVAAAYMTAPYLGTAVSAGDGKVLAGAPAGTALTGLIYGSAFAGAATAQQFFDALAEAAGQPVRPAAHAAGIAT
ncbi:MAG TPA: MFS transporter [Trebonia sp.]|nr:MFS transporter [Trebonia sp.]